MLVFDNSCFGASVKLYALNIVNSVPCLKSGMFLYLCEVVVRGASGPHIAVQVPAICRL